MINVIPQKDHDLYDAGLLAHVVVVFKSANQLAFIYHPVTPWA